MTRLDRLIQLILNHRRVSNEDVFDTVKEYWDDVTSGWGTVDEELAEEIGVTPVALRELLEVNRHTYDYANMGGNSSVRGYDHGDDWIMVMFSDGTRYLYTVKSTSPESITYMKELASAGKGLNSYIVRIQRNNYAGRNVKGEILIKPGMEHYNPEGYRRLQLIEAFRNTMANTVSNEGIVADVKKFFGMSNKSGRKMFLDNMFGWHITESIKENILRPEYLKDQTYIKGEVTGKSVLKYIGKGDKPDTAGALKGMQDFMSARAKAKSYSDQWRQKTKPVEDFLIKNAKSLSPEVYKEARAMMDKIPSQSFSVKYSDKPVVGNGKPDPNPKKIQLVYTPVDATVPALTEEEAIKLAGEISKSLDQFDKTAPNNHDNWPDVMSAMVYTMTPKDYGGVDYDDWHTLVWDILSPDTDEKTAHSARIATRIYWDTVVGLVRYLDVSIKGDSIISGESYQVANEGIFDAIKRLFSSKAESDTPTKPVTKAPVYIWERAGEIEKSPPSQLGDGSSNSPIFQQNGVYNPNWITRLEQDIAQYDRLTKEIIRADKQVAAWANKWEPVLDEFVGDADRKDEFIQVLRQWQAAEPKVWGETFRNNHEFLGWGKYRWEGVESPGFGYYPLQPGATVSIPPLDPNSTRRVVQLIGKLGKQILFGLGEDLTYVGYDFTDAPFRGYAYENDVNDILNKIRYHAHASESPHDHYDVVERRLEIILKALVEYVEAAAVNGTGMEMYKQNLLKTYSKQIVAAGEDGLSPVAQQLMVIGLEAFGLPIKASLESIDAEEIKSPTQRLLVSIESMITQTNVVVSNESLWGAIKYVFGGNYEDLPKINAAYEESVDAVKSTYGNPEWVKKRRLQKGNIKVKGHIEIAKDPTKALDRVKHNNAQALEQTKKVFKDEIEYLSKYIKFLSSTERNDNDKAKALADMFDENFDGKFGESNPIDWGKGGEVPALDVNAIVETAKVFESAMQYRLETDQFYKSGFYKLTHTDSGKMRYGEEGTETAKLEGAAYDLAVAMGERIYSLQEDYYNTVMSDWGNVNDVVKGCLMIMEESAR